MNCVAAIGGVFGAAAAFKRLRAAITAASGGGRKPYPS
jgi:hypothetical protein